MPSEFVAIMDKIERRVARLTAALNHARAVADGYLKGRDELQARNQRQAGQIKLMRGALRQITVMGTIEDARGIAEETLETLEEK